MFAARLVAELACKIFWYVSLAMASGRFRSLAPLYRARAVTEPASPQVKHFSESPVALFVEEQDGHCGFSMKICLPWSAVLLS